jgi:hypothetical protein
MYRLHVSFDIRSSHFPGEREKRRRSGVGKGGKVDDGGSFFGSFPKPFSFFVRKNRLLHYFTLQRRKKLTVQPGLPDFSWYNIPKREKINQITIK